MVSLPVLDSVAQDLHGSCKEQIHPVLGEVINEDHEMKNCLEVGRYATCLCDRHLLVTPEVDDTDQVEHRHITLGSCLEDVLFDFSILFPFLVCLEPDLRGLGVGDTIVLGLGHGRPPL